MNSLPSDGSNTAIAATETMSEIDGQDEQQQQQQQQSPAITASTERLTNPQPTMDSMAVDLQAFLRRPSKLQKSSDDVDIRLEKIGESRKLISEAIDALYDATTLIKKKALQDERLKNRKEREHEMSALHRPCEIRINRLQQDKEALEDHIKQLERKNHELRVNVMELTKERNGMVLEHKISIENSAKLRIYNRLLADKLNAYESGLIKFSSANTGVHDYNRRRVSSANPRLGRDVKSSASTKNTGACAVDDQSFTKSVVLLPTTDDGLNGGRGAVKSTETGENNKLHHGGIGSDDIQEIQIKQDPEMVKVIQEAERAFEDNENLQTIMEIDNRRKREQRWMVTPHTEPRRAQTAQIAQQQLQLRKSTSRPGTATAADKLTDSQFVKQISMLPVERKLRIIYDTQQKMVESLEKCIDHMRVDGDYAHEGIGGDQIVQERRNLVELLDEIKTATIERRCGLHSRANTSKSTIETAAVIQQWQWQQPHKTKEQQQAGGNVEDYKKSSENSAAPPQSAFQRPSTSASRPRTALRTPESSRRNHNYKVTLIEELKNESDDDDGGVLFKDEGGSSSDHNDDDDDNDNDNDDEFNNDPVNGADAVGTDPFMTPLQVSVTIVESEPADDHSSQQPHETGKRPETAPLPIMQKRPNTALDGERTGAFGGKTTVRPASAMPISSTKIRASNSRSVEAVLSNPFKAWIPSRLAVPVKRPAKRYSTVIRPTMYMDGIYRDTVEFRKKTEEERQRLSNASRMHKYLG